MRLLLALAISGACIFCGCTTLNTGVLSPSRLDFVPDADTLYAIPMQTRVAAGEPVTIVVMTGELANPVLYFPGVRIVTETASGFDYVSNSFNIGAIGGGSGQPDGAWRAGAFLMTPDDFYRVVDAGDELSALDFMLIPVGGGAASFGNFSGALFNFQATFTRPGTYKLGFQSFNVVNRTYYQDHNLAPDFFWSDITNDHPALPNSVTVY
jgi:hypothetical protein